MLDHSITTEDRLREALTEDTLPPAKSQRAERLLSRLVSPVRLAILGPKDVGKTSLFNLLAGAPVLPVGAGLPTAQLSWGHEARTVCLTPDGSRRDVDAANARALVDGRAMLLELQRALPALRRVALLEVVMDGSEDAQRKALAWAAKRCDMAIWCTRAFQETEQRLWASMPKALQGHALLVMTHADTLGDQGAVKRQLDDITKTAGRSFQTIRPLSARQALDAIAADGSIHAETWKRTGAQALITAVLETVQAGRAKVREAAEALLRESVPSAAVNDALSSIVAPAPPPAAAHHMAQPPLEPCQPTLSEYGRGAMDKAVTYLAQRAEELADILYHDPQDATAQILSGLSSDTAWLSEYLSEPFHADEARIAPVRAFVEEVTDMMQLLALEKTESATADAACLVLQARRQLQALATAA